MTTKGSIYVGNLPQTFSENELRQLFEELGDIESVVCKEGKSKDGNLQTFNFGFVNFVDVASVEPAIASCAGRVVQGRILTVRRSERDKKSSSASSSNGRNWQARNGDSNSRPSSRGSDNGMKKPLAYEELVTITYVLDPQTLYVQAINRDNLEKLSIILSKLQEYCQSAPRLSGNPERSKMYGAVFAEDGAWYRCRVVNHNSVKAQVNYIDYGNSAEVVLQEMAELSEELCRITPLAQKIRIIGVAPQLTDSSLDAANQAYSYLNTLDDDSGASKKLKIIIAEGVAPLEDGSLPIQLFCSNANVAEILNKKFAPEYQEPVHNVLPTGGSRETNRENKSGGDAMGRSQRKGRQAARPQRDNSQYKKIKNLEDIVEQLTDEKLVLQKQLIDIKTQAQHSADYATRQLNEALQVRLSPLAESCKRVKEARNGFVIDPDSKNTIQSALQLVVASMVGSPTKRNSDIISLIPDSEPVGQRLQELESMQQALQNYESQDELPELMLKRNDARHEAFKALTTFLDDVKKLPIAKRLEDIEAMLTKLQTEYGSYLDPSKVLLPDEMLADEECFDVYKNWLAEKCSAIGPVREITDTLRSQWCTLLANMQESFQFCEAPSPSLELMDRLREDFLGAMETEVTLTLHGYVPATDLGDSTIQQIKQEQDVREVEVVSSTVQGLVRVLVGEKQTMDSLSQLCARFEATAAQLNPWLNNRPDVSHLQTVMKEIKTLRSRLRHKLADRHDMEEDPDLNNDEALEKLGEEIQGIKDKLWTSYQEESKQLRELAELTSNHFPELPCLYPAFNIPRFLETNGLVREGRDLKHFDLSPVPECDKTTVKLGLVNRTPVCFIKIIHLPESNTLEKIVAFSAIEVPNLMPIQAVYNQPDSSQLFVQLPYMGLGNLESALRSDHAPSKAEVISVCRDVLEALDGLHRLGLVHGGLHPRNVLLESVEGASDEKPSISAKLSEFDFTRTTNETALKGFTTETGVRFTAPEVNCGLQATSQADVFAAGLLLLWALFPTTDFKMEPDGIPDLTSNDLPPSLVDLLEAMLNYSPMKRPSAARVLEAPFFVNSPEFVHEVVLEEEAKQEEDVKEEVAEMQDGEVAEVQDGEVDEMQDGEVAEIQDGENVDDLEKVASESLQELNLEDAPVNIGTPEAAKQEANPAASEQCQESVSCELTVSQDSPSKQGPPPLEDDEEEDGAEEVVIAEEGVAEEGVLKEEGSKHQPEEPATEGQGLAENHAEVDDNSSPV